MATSYCFWRYLTETRDGLVDPQHFTTKRFYYHFGKRKKLQILNRHSCKMFGFMQIWVSLLVSGQLHCRSTSSPLRSPSHRCPLEVGAAAVWLCSSPTNTAPACGASSPAADPLRGERQYKSFLVKHFYITRPFKYIIKAWKRHIKHRPMWYFNE